jgi:hypothetical protein
MAVRAFGLSKPAAAAPFWKELLQVITACTVASVFVLLFPLTSQSGAFSGRIVLYFLPTAAMACLSGGRLVCYDQIQTTVQTCERAGVEAKYLSDVFQLSLARPRFEPNATAPVVNLKVVQDDYRLLVKRCIDVVGALVGLVLLWPLMIAICSGHPADEPWSCSLLAGTLRPA